MSHHALRTGESTSEWEDDLLLGFRRFVGHQCDQREVVPVMRFLSPLITMLLLVVSSSALAQEIQYNTRKSHADVIMAEEILEKAWEAVLRGDIEALNAYICDQIRVPAKMTGAQLAAKAKNAKDSDRFDFFREFKFLRSSRTSSRLRVSYVKADTGGTRRYLIYMFGRSSAGWQWMDARNVRRQSSKDTELQGLKDWLRGNSRFELKPERDRRRGD